MSDNPTPDESAFNAFGTKVSTRGVLALILVVALAGLTFMHPEQFSKAFESVAIAVIGFYFGQSKR
jgi:hypothetical protein